MNVFAQSDAYLFNNFFTIISRINSGEIILSPKSDCNLSDTASFFLKKKSALSKNENPNFNKCAIEMCGLPQAVKSVWVTDTNFTNNITPAVLKKVNSLTPRITKLLKTSLEKRALALKNAKKNWASQNLKFDELEIEEKSEFDFKIFGKYLTLKKDPNATLAKKIQFVLNSEKMPPLNLRLAVNQYVSDLNEYIFANFFKEEFNDLFVNDDYKELLTRQVNKLKEMIKMKKIDDKNEIHQYLTSLKSFQSKDLTKDDLTKISELFKPIYEILSIDYGFNQYLFPDCIHVDCQKGYNDLIKSPEVVKKINALEAQIENPDSLQNAVNKCKAVLLFSEIKSSEKKKTEEVFKLAVSKVKTNLLPKFSNHSQKLLFDYLDRKLTHTSIDYFRNQKSANLTSFSEREKTFYDHQNFLDKKPQYRSLREVIDLLEYKGEPDLFLDAFPCGNQSLRSWDFFLPSSNHSLLKGPEVSFEKNIIADLNKNIDRDIISISDFTCNSGNAGLQIVSHEIGHALNNFFKLDGLSKESALLHTRMKSCVTTKYKDNFETRKILQSKDGENVFTEEDLADLLALLSNNQNQEIYFCSFLKPDLNKKSYNDLSFMDTDVDHSTPFTRVLQEATQKGIKFSKACNELINEEKPPLEFRKCDF